MASIILPVPHILQRQPGECLAACAAMMLTYLALPVNYNRLLKLLQVKPDIGAPSFNIRRLKTLKVDVTYKQGTLVELQDQLINNRPCLAFVQTVELLYWNKEENNHAVVVVGLDDDYVYVNDPAFLRQFQDLNKSNVLVLRVSSYVKNGTRNTQDEYLTSYFLGTT